MIEKVFYLRNYSQKRMHCSRLLPAFFALFMLFLLNACNSGETSNDSKGKEVVSTPSSPILLEIIGDRNSEQSTNEFRQFLAQNNQDTNAIYQWKNHLLAMVDSVNASIIEKKAIAQFPTSQIKIYEKPFYAFHQQNCANPTLEKEWDYIFLTTNLVEDTAKQRAYFNYHDTQFEQWPEVAKGFCNAGFQRLLVYHNNRQLMLIINIPKGQSLDSLNPKTTENNPRVDDWNKLMAQYQEGLPGTAPGEVWVFLNAVKKED